MSQFYRSQEFLVRLFAYVDKLILHGKTREEAIDHASQQFGVLRMEVSDLLAKRTSL